MKITAKKSGSNAQGIVLIVDGKETKSKWICFDKTLLDEKDLEKLVKLKEKYAEREQAKKAEEKKLKEIEALKKKIAADMETLKNLGAEV